MICLTQKYIYSMVLTLLFFQVGIERTHRSQHANVYTYSLCQSSKHKCEATKYIHKRGKTRMVQTDYCISDSMVCHLDLANSEEVDDGMEKHENHLESIGFLDFVVHSLRTILAF